MSKKLSDEELLNELRKRFEQNKQSLNELSQLNQELKIANSKLEESEALKSHFISNITNEIINPFSSILGLSKHILEFENSKQIQSMAQLIHSEAFNLDFQLKNIFMAAEIEAGEIHPQYSNVEVKQVVRNVIADYQYELQKKQLAVEIDDQIECCETFYFKTDAMKLHLILVNLLNNAIKYSKPEAQIIVRLWKSENKFCFEVQDFGIGISESNQEVIFDRFKRIDSGINSLNRGHGLGLSVVKALTDILEGEIKIESEIDKGAKFIVQIPETEIEHLDDFASDGSEVFFGDDDKF